jgi:hypothetical protein
MPEPEVLDVTDEELAVEALAADPDVDVPDDAVPFEERFGERIGEHPGGLLPDWYMPPPRSFRRTRPRVVAAVGLVLALLLVNVAGLCVTYGWPEIAW